MADKNGYQTAGPVASGPFCLRRKRRSKRVPSHHPLSVAVFVSLLWVACQTPPPKAERVAPATLPPYVTVGEKVMVATAEEEASKIGVEIIKRGGNAADAAVAVSWVLSVMDLHHTGIAGGGFALVKPAGTDKVTALDFRETAPRAAKRDMYLRGGKADTALSLDGPLSVAVPGLVAGLMELYQRFGSSTIRWEELLEPAIRIADEGFLVTPELAEAILNRRDVLQKYPDSARLLLPGGTPIREGDRLVQKELANTLRTIAKEGRQGFYQGKIAEAIVRSLKKSGGMITLDDLTAYQVKERPVIEGSYRGYRIYSMPPPSSGGVHLVQILNILEGYPSARLRNDPLGRIHLVSEACRSAYADRALFLGDPNFVDVPVTRLVSKEYAAELRDRITPRARASSSIRPQSTTHFSIVDDQGMVVSSTQTINYTFGSGFMVPGTGILLNDEMDDFATQPGVPNVYGLIGAEANAIAPQKRPLSSMTPTIVLDPQGEFYAAVGAAGGPRIITSVLQTLVNLVDRDLDPGAAVASPRTHHQWLPDHLVYEPGALEEETQKGLIEKGHQLKEGARLGRVHLVARWGNRLYGVSDPRGEGKPAGF